MVSGPLGVPGQNAAKVQESRTEEGRVADPSTVVTPVLELNKNQQDVLLTATVRGPNGVVGHHVP